MSFLLDTNVLSELRRGDRCHPNVPDSLIAATALHHGLTVATRNESDFTRCGAEVVNPFKDQS